MTDRHGAAAGHGGPAAGANEQAGGRCRRHDRTCSGRPSAAAHRRASARAAGRALDLLMYGERKQADPRPACRATAAHLKECGLWGELSYRVLGDLVREWQAGR